MSADLNLRPGSEVMRGDVRYIVIKNLDLNSVLGRQVGTDLTVPLMVEQLRPALHDKRGDAPVARDLEAFPQYAWDEAVRRETYARRYLEDEERTRALAEKIAAEAGVSTPTLYRWIAAYRIDPTPTALLPTRRDGGRGKSRIDAEVAEVITGVLEDHYFSRRRPRVARALRLVHERCRERGLPLPAWETVHGFVQRHPKAEAVARREGKDAADQLYQERSGMIAGADWPLAVTEIDHMQANVVLVDNIYREPLGRPWITLLIDVFSRIVLGFFVSLEPPCALSAGQCIARAILRKERYLKGLGLDLQWPVWGVPKLIIADNARELRGNMFRRAGLEYKTVLQWRPTKKPHFGAHIERLVGTVKGEIDDLEATTFRNAVMRNRYPSERFASMTELEFEIWLAIFLLGVYHQRLHSGIRMSPLQRWEQGILGTDHNIGTGLPAVHTDEERVTLDWTPYVERTVQPTGVQIDYVRYMSPILRPYINARDPEHPRRKLKLRFRRNPRNISGIYFFDPVSKQYVRVPTRHVGRPPVSLSELRVVERRLREEGEAKIDEDAIYGAIGKMRRQEDESKKATKAVRRALQRRPAPEVPPAPVREAVTQDVGDEDDDVIAPYADGDLKWS